MKHFNFWGVSRLIAAICIMTLASVSSAFAAADYAALAQTTNTVSIDNVVVEVIAPPAASSGTFSIALANVDAVASGQIRFTYDAAFGLQITDAQLTSRGTGFSLNKGPYATGNPALLGYQVLFFNLSSLTIAPGTGAILTISYTTTANASGSIPL